MGSFAKACWSSTNNLCRAPLAGLCDMVAPSLLLFWPAAIRLKKGKHRDAVRHDCGESNHQDGSDQNGTEAPRAFRRRRHYFWIEAGRWSGFNSSERITGWRRGWSVGSLLRQPQVHRRWKLRQASGRLPVAIGPNVLDRIFDPRLCARDRLRIGRPARFLWAHLIAHLSWRLRRKVRFPS